MSADFSPDCLGCPFQTGDFVLTEDYVDNFVCQCDCLSNCSYYTSAKDFVEEFSCGENGDVYACN